MRVTYYLRLPFPERPDRLIVNGTDTYNSVSLKWFVTYDGNSPITHFFVTHRYNTSKITRETVYRVARDLLELHIDNLEVGVTHFFAVEAENRVGKSDSATVAKTIISTGRY